MSDFEVSPESTAKTEKVTKDFGEAKESQLAEVRIDKMVLYHGSPISGLTNLNTAEETTLGQGLYLTSDQKAGLGYALRRAKGRRDAIPTVYEVEVKNMRLADFREPKTLAIFAELLGKTLAEEIKDPSLPWYGREAIQRTLKSIRNKSYKCLRDLAWHHQDLTTRIIEDQGFDGLIDIEGGEGEEVQEHDSYVIFDPSKS